MGIRKLIRRIGGVAAPGNPASAKHAQNAQVVFDTRDLRGGAVLDHRLNLLDIAIAFRTLCQHNRGAPFAIDMARRKEGRIQNVHGHAVFAGHVRQTAELFHGGIHAPIRDSRGSHDILDAPAAKRLKGSLGIPIRASAAAAIAPATGSPRSSAISACDGRAGDGAIFTATTATARGGSELHERSFWRGGRCRR